MTTHPDRFRRDETYSTFPGMRAGRIDANNDPHIRVWQREGNIVAGGVYRASISLFPDLSPPESDPFNVTVDIVWWGADNRVISRSEVVRLTVDEYDFTHWTDLVTAPAGVEFAHFRIVASGMSGHLYIDDARFTLVE
jgi:hypothetical protein